MTTAPALPTTRQIGLFDPPAAPKTQVCAKCGHARPLNLFAWADASKTARLDICNTCRFPSDTRGPSTKRAKATAAPQPRSKKLVEAPYLKAIDPQPRSKKLVEAPYLKAIDPQPLTAWVKAGDLVPVFVNIETTGQTVVGVLYITSATQTDRLRKTGRYTRVRNWFVKLGCQVLELRRSVAAPLIERTAREGRTYGN